MKKVSQIPGADSQEMISPTPMSAPTRLLLVVAVILDLDLFHLNVEAAFIQSNLDGDICMKLSLGCGNFEW